MIFFQAKSEEVRLSDNLILLTIGVGIFSMSDLVDECLSYISYPYSANKKYYKRQGDTECEAS